MTDQPFKGLNIKDKTGPEGPPAVIFTILAYLLLLLLGGIDLYDESRFSYAVLYLLPVGILSWYFGRWHGLFAAFVAGGLSLASLLKSPPVHFHPNQLFIESILNLFLFIVFSHLVARVKEARQQEIKFSRTDSLTKAANARAFYDMADQELKRARRYNHPLTILYLDLDNFHRINDDMGIQASNTLLFTLAYTLKKSTREVDTAARIGGDDFTLLLPNTDEDQGNIVVERIRSALNAVMTENKWPVTVSIGMATFHKIPPDADELMRAANRLMLKAKEDGGNRAVSEVFKADH